MVMSTETLMLILLVLQFVTFAFGVYTGKSQLTNVLIPMGIILILGRL